MTEVSRRRRNAAELEKKCLLAMLIYCGLLAGGWAYVLGYAPESAGGPRVPSSTTIDVPPPLTSLDGTIGYR